MKLNKELNVYENNNIQYERVTNFIHNFIPQKDFKSIAINYVNKRSKQELIEDLNSKFNIPKDEINLILLQKGTVEGVIYIWEIEKERACLQGTEYHDLQENKDIDKGCFNGDNFKNIDNLFELNDGVYTELFIKNDKYKIAGKSDKVIIETSDDIDLLASVSSSSSKGTIRYVDIEDYKTNKELKINYNYIDKNNKPIINEFMNYPINGFVNCNWIHYCLQLSLYGYMLEQYGFVVRSLKIHHTKDYGKSDYTTYELPYYKKEIIQMLSLK